MRGASQEMRGEKPQTNEGAWLTCMISMAVTNPAVSTNVNQDTSRASHISKSQRTGKQLHQKTTIMGNKGLRSYWQERRITGKKINRKDFCDIKEKSL